MIQLDPLLRNPALALEHTQLGVDAEVMDQPRGEGRDLALPARFAEASVASVKSFR
jgi:hypothetical protein